MRNFVELNARNIVNLEEIEKFLKELSQDIEKTEIIEWIKKPLKKYIKEDLLNVSKVTVFKKSDPDWLKKSVEEGTALKVVITDREFKKEVGHVLDFFKSMEEDELKKIYKIPFKIAVEKSKEWTKELHRKAPLDIDEAGESIIRSYSKGVTWKRLLTTESLEREGSIPRMDHCIGGDNFQEKLLNNKAEFYSLRDKNDHPQCTIEVERNHIEQMKGYNDGPVLEEFCKYCKDFIEKPINRKKYSKIKDLGLIGMVESDGKLYEINNLPENFTVNGDLNFSDSKLPITLPKGLTVIGDLMMYNCTSLEKLPEGLTVKGELDLYGCTLLKSLPNKLSVKLSLNLMGCTSLESIPKDIFIGESLDLEGCTLLKPHSALPEMLTIPNSLNLTRCTSLKSLPERLTVGNLSLIGCFSLISLPNKLIVYNRLYLNGCNNIISLPKDLIADGPIIVDDNFPIEKYPIFKLISNTKHAWSEL